MPPNAVRWERLRLQSKFEARKTKFETILKFQIQIFQILLELEFFKGGL